MKTVTEPSRVIPVIAETDVLVAGGGPAGLTAALAAARAGAKTLIVERYGCLGGMLTQVGVESFAWYRHPGTVDCEGIGREFERRAKEAGFTRPEPQSMSNAIDTEGFKVIADQMIKEAGVTPLYHTLVTDVLKDGDTVTGVVVESKSGRGAILASRLVDCTGDADVAARAGASFTRRDKDTAMGVTVMFTCAGVNVPAFEAFVRDTLKPTYADWGKNWTIKTSGKEDAMFSPYLEEIFERAKADGVIPGDASAIAGTWSTFTESGEALQLNMVYAFGFDCTDARDLTQAEITGRQQALWAICALRRYAPGFEKARLRSFGMTLGTRESRLIEGEVRVADEYVLNQGRCDDSVGIFPEFIDGSGYLILPTTGHYFQIPYGCLVPKQIENLLVAGRCISGGVLAHTSMRNMMCCTVTGQAAGVAAAVSLQHNCAPRAVPMNLLQDALRRQGVRLD